MRSNIYNIIDAIKEHQKIKIDKFHNYELFNKITIAHYGSALEGSRLTLTESTVLIKEGLCAGGKPLTDHLMVLDHYKALEFVLNLADERRSNNKPFEVKDIQNIASLVCKNNNEMVQSILGTTNTSNGDIRLTNVFAGKTLFMSYNKVPKELLKFIQFVNESIKTIDKDDVQSQLFLSFEAHFRLVSIHPFTDGNGRTSRLFSNLIQRFYNLPLGINTNDTKEEYINALVKSRTQNDLDPIYKYLSGEYFKYINGQIKLL